MTGRQKQNQHQTNECPEEVLANIRAARAAYARRWRQKNPEKQAAITARYWAKRAAQLQKQAHHEQSSE
ncbi:MAG: hypothetical protein IJ119_15900 [Clostridia bacterium]|nr:hypothetical protein [Clostridia bacterium]